VGSYFVAEAIKRKELFCKISEQNPKTTPSAIQTAIKN
jgi:hypothetical protein